MTETDQQPEYIQQFRGRFVSAMKWHHLDELWQRIKLNPRGWYIYAVDAQPPALAASTEQLLKFIDEVDLLLHEGHQEDYCGIVYADDLENPQMIKIYDPDNLGVVCGFSDNPPLPGWVLSRSAPVELLSQQQMTQQRKRWWQRIFSD